VYAPATSQKKDVAAKRLLRARSTFSKSLMVSVSVSKLGYTNLIFVDPGAKVNGAYYRNVLLSQQLLPAIRHILGEFFIFQQDSAQHTGHVRQSAFWNVRRRHLSHQICGRQAAQT